MSVRIRLKRFGSKKRPDYRIVVMDSRTKAQGRPSTRLANTIPSRRKSNKSFSRKTRSRSGSPRVHSPATLSAVFNKVRVGSRTTEQ